MCICTPRSSVQLTQTRPSRRGGFVRMYVHGVSRSPTSLTSTPQLSTKLRLFAHAAERFETSKFMLDARSSARARERERERGGGGAPLFGNNVHNCSQKSAPPLPPSPGAITADVRSSESSNLSLFLSLSLSLTADVRSFESSNISSKHLKHGFSSSASTVSADPFTNLLSNVCSLVY